MRRLSATDSSFLSIETDAWPMHVGGLITLDTTDVPDFGFERVRELFGQRMQRVPKMTWKLWDVPFGLGRPLWTQGHEFDIDQCLQRIEVPPPGGPRELGTLAGDLMRGRLDHRMPMLRLWYLDGLPDGTAAIFSKYHHALMDGSAGASLSDIMLDLEPDPAPAPAREGVTVEDSGGRDLSLLEAMIASGLSLIASPVNVARFAGALVRRLADLAPVVLKQGVPAALVNGAPRTSFNRAVGPRRELAFASVSLADVRSVRKRIDVTVNDIIVALCMAAVERYLAKSGEEVPRQPLSVMVPVSMRAPGDLELTNRVSAIPISVPTDVGDLERVRAISREVDKGKLLTNSYRGRPLPSIGELLPPVLLGTAARATKPFARWMPVMANTLVSSVRGSPLPLYVAGARVTGTYSASVIQMNFGVNFTALSTADQIDVGIMADPDLVQDPWLLADAIPAALEALMQAAGVGDPHPVPLLSVTTP